MVVNEIKESDNFKRIKSKLDKGVLIKLSKQIEKIIENPEIGKPMRYNRKGTREVYIPPHRLSYAYSKEKGVIYLLDLYHKDEQ
ncbi:MAG: type II toxin-antitoxin system RelE/ParE family toxin [Nanoarchaeota archaeon]|nr:type II toxin-antitoxin system RelE/ParE family toxin [Nanoarchaeota archaeon]